MPDRNEVGNRHGTPTLGDAELEVTLPAAPGSAPSEAAPAAPQPAGSKIGRHVIIERLGEGGMGIVYAAYDPELDRKLAIKLIRSDKSTSTDQSIARARLAREAQAMAKVSHPNVIHIYDVGTHEGQVYIAMEFVEGPTLAAWMEERHPWREVLEVLVRAGRGLAAAHATGLVHRDFKPENVLLGADGRVRVLDFGLARASDEPAEPGTPPHQPCDLTALENQPTPSEDMGGTPAYMAPEQMEGKPTDARTDQFSFCVALYQGLYGERPFAGDNVGALAYALLHGEIRDPPAESRVPAWLRRVLLRGLSVAPEDRYPSMEVLLAELRKDPAVVWRRWIAAAAAACLIGAAGWGLHATQQAQEQRCGGAEQRLVGVWDQDRKQSVEKAFLATGLPYAQRTWAGVERTLDRYTAAWVRMHMEACEATHVRGEQSGELLDLRMACLGDRLRDLRALMDVLAEADAKVVERAVHAAASLRTLDRCADAKALRAEIEPPEDPGVAAGVEAERERLARATALEEAGKYDAGLAIADEVVSAAQELGYRPLQAEALRRVGSLKDKKGDYEAAEASFSEAYFIALAIGHDQEAAEAAAGLVVVVGFRQARHEAGLAWGRHAEAAVERVGKGGVEEARLLNNLGLILGAQGKHEAAGSHHERALAIWEKVLGPDHPDVASSLNNLGMGLEAQGKYEDARAYYERALAIKEKALGSSHPDVSVLLNNLGLLLETEGKYEEARSHYERALRSKEKTLGPEHPSVAISLNNLGIVLGRLGEYDEALAAYGRSLAIFETALGSDHPVVAHPLTGLGETYIELEEPEKAIESLERALTLRTAKKVAPRDLAATRFALARALWKAARDRRRAVDLAGQARDGFREAGDAGKEALVQVETWLADSGSR